MNFAELDIFACPVCQRAVPPPAIEGWSCQRCGALYPAGSVPITIPVDKISWAEDAHDNRLSANVFYQERIDNNNGWWVDRSAHYATLRRHDWLAYREPIAHYVRGRYTRPIIVDAGGGDGWFLKGCEDLIPGMRGVLIDLSDTVVQNGIERHHFRTVSGFSGSIEHLPFRTDSVDVVVSIEVLEHVRNPEDFFASVWRILRPGGCFVLTTPNPLSYALGFEEGRVRGMMASLLAALKGRAALTQSAVREVDGILERYLTPKQIVSFAKMAGFGKVIYRSVGIGFAPKPYYLAERLKCPVGVLKLYSEVASRIERAAVLGGWLPWGKVQRVTCIK